ncbi:hypothetical protein [Pelagibacterium luteolum]|uniref:Uncharacterized protein n=1 Tax=Pelagibacterium luteolum TaxID=440168 RepID=A0A1G7ZNH9_9HYPH|nr:hypothetical protein [Pelagibacterium luteolum]SDH09660.1 hypothetical protein SAMN04487974_1214 [Pelagibacterium luteolum]
MTKSPSNPHLHQKVKVGDLSGLIYFDHADSIPDYEFRRAVEQINVKIEPFSVDANKLYEAVLSAEGRMNARKLPHEDRAGFKLTVRPAGPGSSSEQRSAKSVEYRFERTPENWYLVDAKAIRVQRGHESKMQFFATREQIKQIRKLAVAGLRVAK